MKALGGDHRKEKGLFDVPDGDFGIEVVSVKFLIHGYASITFSGIRSIPTGNGPEPSGGKNQFLIPCEY